MAALVKGVRGHRVRCSMHFVPSTRSRTSARPPQLVLEECALNDDIRAGAPLLDGSPRSSRVDPGAWDFNDRSTL